jgi:hypothetical protein
VKGDTFADFISKMSEHISRQTAEGVDMAVLPRARELEEEKILRRAMVQSGVMRKTYDDALLRYARPNLVGEKFGRYPNADCPYCGDGSYPETLEFDGEVYQKYCGNCGGLR